MGRSILLGGLIPLLLPVLAGAQILPRLTPDDARREPLPEPRLEAAPEAPLATPAPALPPPPSPGLGESLTVRVERIELRGNTVFSDAELAPLTAPYEGREVSTAELQQLRYDLTRFYVERGYINSGAVIPDQSVADGVVRLDIVEGRLTDIRLSGNTHLRERYLRERLWPDPQAPLDLERLRERLRLVQQDPLVARINAELVPGLLPGEGVLRAEVAEAPRVRFGLVIANNRSPSVGGEQYEPFLSLRNLTGFGDILDLSWGITSGGDDVSALYELPLNAHDTRLRLGYRNSDSLAVESPFDALDIQSDLRSWDIGLSHPLILTPDRRLTLGATLSLRKSETSLLGFGFPFSPGVDEDGDSRVTVLRLSQDYLHRGPDQVLALRSTFSLGLDAFGATTNDLHIDGRFTAWLGQFQWVRRFENDLQIVLRADAQFSKDSLLPMEKFSIGGATSVRGYRESLLVRDSGYAGSVELRYPLATLPIPGLSRDPGDGQLQLALFADYGRGWNEDLPTPDPEAIGSVGVGLRYAPGPQVEGALYWGYALEEVEQLDEDIQDEGLHFLLRISNF